MGSINFEKKEMSTGKELSIKLRRLNEYLKYIGYYNCFDENGFNFEIFKRLIRSITFEQAKCILININAILNERGRLNKGFDHGLGTVGYHVAPAFEITLDLFEDYFKAIQGCEDMKVMAELIYYGILDIHRFTDGNGRTSRFLYDMAIGKIDFRDTINYIDLLYYFHLDGEKTSYISSENGKRELARYAFCEQRNLVSADAVNLYLSRFEFCPEELKPKLEEFYKEGITRIKTHTTDEEGIYSINLFRVPVGSYFFKLSAKQQSLINLILLDNEGYYTVGALTLLQFFIENPQYEDEFNEWIRLDLEEKQGLKRVFLTKERKETLIFRIDNHREFFSKLTVAEYKRIIEIGNSIKRQREERLIELITRGGPIQNDIKPKTK